MKYAEEGDFAAASPVAPHWGAWIEIQCERITGVAEIVAPHWGAWIEIALQKSSPRLMFSRTPLGCVD